MRATSSMYGKGDKMTTAYEVLVKPRKKEPQRNLRCRRVKYYNGS